MPMGLKFSSESKIFGEAPSRLRATFATVHNPRAHICNITQPGSLIQRLPDPLASESGKLANIARVCSPVALVSKKAVEELTEQ